MQKKRSMSKIRTWWLTQPFLLGLSYKSIWLDCLTQSQHQKYNHFALAVAESRHRSICVNRNFELLVTRCILIQAYQKKSYIRTKLSNPSRDMLLYSCPYAPIRLVSEFATITLIVGGELWGDTAVQTPSSSAPHHQLLIIIPLHFKRCWGLWKSLAHGSSNWHFVWQSTSHSLPTVDGCKVSQYTRNWPVLSSCMHV